MHPAGNSPHRLVTRYPIGSFFVLAYLISWVLWLPLLYGRFALGWTGWEGSGWTSLRPYLGMLGAIGPALAAVIMTATLHGRAGLRTLSQRLLLWRTPRWTWLLALYASWALATIIAFTLGLAPVKTVSLGFAFALINLPVLIFILQAPLLIGIVGEEVGWRGFALPALLQRFNPLVASLLLGVGWIFWHAPLAVFPEWRGHQPLGLFVFNYALLVLPLTLIFTWFFRRTHGSILLAIVLHRAFNLTFNAYQQALGLSEAAARDLRHTTIAGLWIIAALLTFHDFRKRGFKSRNQKGVESAPSTFAE